MTTNLTEKHKQAEGLLALAPGRAPPPEVMMMTTLATLMLIDVVKIFDIYIVSYHKSMEHWQNCYYFTGNIIVKHIG